MQRLTFISRNKLRLPFFVLPFLALLASALLVNLDRQVVLAQDDSAYEEELLKGKDLLRRRRYEEALKSLKRANEMKQKRSVECYNLMCEAYFGLGAFKNVIENAEKVIELAGDDSQLVLMAYNHKGLALQAQSQNKDQKKLQEAEAAFRKAISINSTQAILHHNLGVVLLQQNLDAEGIAELKQYLEMAPHAAEIGNVRRLIENPRRAREHYAPDFSITTSEGEHIALDDLKGKVVVLDFWGTWCPPCVESVPSLRSLHKRYSKEPSFVLIGISTDREEDVWRDFTAKNKMIWPQYWDRDGRVSRAFGVRAFPTYIVIDHEGIVRFQSIGSSWIKAANLEEAIKKQVKIAAKGVEIN